MGSHDYLASDTELSPAHGEFAEVLKAVLTRRTKTD
jgi:hypothetical protein